MAQVKELRAQVALAGAVDKETAAQEHVNTVEAARQSLAKASNTCVVDGRSMDLARYELLTRLDAALSHRWKLANDALDDAAQRRIESASENVVAKRHRELVGEHLDSAELAWIQSRAAKAQEDGIELWLGSREEAS
ncbi:hypothetical protein [Dyella caseinilytica]|uniref:Flagellar FliJ protein n=1 Tax=Dyella caseinilytica TaxID=1849581 RepID=A0ABX7GQ69_9GAMM|nr:hypothetical protein [Dyella caseinilytica]QRN52059.1 hypothetical protein ISN74_11130 [Dyella caseinilytica]